MQDSTRHAILKEFNKKENYTTFCMKLHISAQMHSIYCVHDRNCIYCIYLLQTV